MFSITISEKGGAERREAFDKTEINIGRVQGNDLMLPKGNVSKHHARLLFRDGRFIVTDLKSTNGTYVNGRKIAQATIVREGDKIYIGDFVLRIESQAGAGAADQANPPFENQEELDTANRPNGPPPARGATPPPRSVPPPVPPAAAQGAAAALAPSSPPPAVAPSLPPAPTPAAPPAISVAPHMGSTRTGPVPVATAPAPARGNASAAPPVVTSLPQPPQPAAPPPAVQQAAPVPAPAPYVAPMRAGPSRVPPRESPAAAGRRLALVTLLDRVSDATDLAPIRLHALVDDGVAQRIERTVREQAAAMRTEGEVPEGIDVDQLARHATQELVGLGPIGALLDDDEVTEIHCIRHDHMIIVRGGQSQAADVSFTSEESLGRVIARLAHQSGEPIRPGEWSVERRLSRGHMVALLPPVASGHALLLRKRRRLDVSIEELVRLGAVSRAMATFLENCVAARANVLVCSPQRAAVSSVITALATASAPGDRIVAVQDVEECTVPQAHVLAVGLPDLGTRGEAVLRASARLLPDRLVVAPVAGQVGTGILDVIAEGAEGVLAGIIAPSLRQALARLVGQMASARSGGVEAARDAVGESFDVAVEVVALPDGRTRVVRVAELSGSDAKGVVARDLFTSTEDGQFASTGVVPRAVADFAARGVRVDPNLFKRAVGR